MRLDFSVRRGLGLGSLETADLTFIDILSSTLEPDDSETGTMIVHWLTGNRGAQAQSSLLVRLGAMSGVLALLLTLVNTGLVRLSAGAQARDPGAAQPAAVVAEPAARLPFQGRLLDAKGEPIATREVKALFTLYDAEVGDGVKWSSGSLTLTVDRGGLVVRQTSIDG